MYHKYIYFLFIIFLCSCSTNSKYSKYQNGVASWYGKPFHGRKAANGEIFNMRKLTAAHKTLPFGTIVKILNPDNGKTVKVRIIDRGPFVKGRDFDLSKKAFKKIAPIDKGVIKIKYKIINKR